MKSCSLFVSVGVVTGGLCAVHLVAAAPSIGINLGDQETPATHLSGTQRAGVVPQENWNDYGNTAGSGMVGKLIDSTGAVTTAVGSELSGAYYTDISGGGSVNSANGDEILNNGGQYDNPTITVTHIPYAHYSVYVYTLLDHSSTFSVTVTPAVGAPKTFFGTTPNPGTAGYESGVASGYTYIAATGTTQATANAGADYAVFTGLTSSTFTAAVANFGGNNAAIDGIQIVDDK